MRVLHVINGLTTGGAEAVLYRLATYPSDVEHEVVCLEGRDWYSEQLESAGVRVEHLNCGSALFTATAALRLYRLVKASGPDVIQAWMYRSNIIASVAGKLAGVPVIWNIRCSSVQTLRPRSRLIAYIGGFAARWAASAVLNCSAASRQVHARLGYDAVPGLVIPNGYDPTEFEPDERERKKMRDSLGVKPDSFIVGSIGRWDPHKSYPVLFRALKVLNDRGIPLRLLLVGRDLDRSNPELVQLIDESGCTGLVEPLGHRLDIPVIARSLDVHVLASVSEGFPNVVAETMLAQSPNVVTDVGDARLIVGDTGWVIGSPDPVTLADAIERAHSEWSTSPDRWQRRRSAARDRVVSNFSLERMVSAYQHVWKEVASGRPLDKQALEHHRGDLPIIAPLGPAQEQPKILHIINSLVLGGAETLLYRLVSRGSPEDHVIVSLAGPGWYSQRLQERGVAVHHLGMKSPSDARGAAARLKTIIRESGANVVQCWMYRSNVFGGVIAKSEGKPVVWGIHCASLKPLRSSSRALAYLSGILARWTPDSIIICSRAAAVLHARLGYSAAHCEVIHNGYDPDVFAPDEAARTVTRRALGVGPSDFVVGTISRWDPLKDIPNLLAALRIAHEQGVPLHGFLIGAGLTDDNPELRAELRRSNCSDFVHPLGRRSDIEDVARALDLHVLASRTEAFPNVVAETMLCGTPNVATDVGDSALMVGTAGWLVPPRSPERLAAAIVDAYREFKDRPARWAERRQAAREQIAENFSIDRMSEGYEQTWRRAWMRDSVSSS